MQLTMPTRILPTMTKWVQSGVMTPTGRKSPQETWTMSDPPLHQPHIILFFIPFAATSGKALFPLRFILLSLFLFWKWGWDFIDFLQSASRNYPLPIHFLRYFAHGVIMEARSCTFETEYPVASEDKFWTTELWCGWETPFPYSGYGSFLLTRDFVLKKPIIIASIFILQERELLQLNEAFSYLSFRMGHHHTAWLRAPWRRKKGIEKITVNLLFGTLGFWIPFSLLLYMFPHSFSCPLSLLFVDVSRPRV